MPLSPSAPPASPLWGALLDHITRESDQPEVLVDFYSKALGMKSQQESNDCWTLRGPQRRLIIRRGRPVEQPMQAFRLRDDAHLSAMRKHCEQRNLHCTELDNPFLSQCFSVLDPDDRQLVFGLDESSDAADGASGTTGLPGRLQHVVVATTNLGAMVNFYRDTLGFAESDNVFDGPVSDGNVTASFMRSDPEHHSFAAFLAPEKRPDHLCFETNEWNDIRDWADHMSRQHIKLWWGPGRHGPGNNLFFMIEDPEGYKLELSAEIEHVPQEIAPRQWTHEERTLNLWGNAWMRS